MDGNGTTSAGMREVMWGADTDATVSADAMRWSPSRARSTDVDGVDCSTGIAAALRPRVRRLAVGVIGPFACVAADLADDARRLWRGRTLAEPRRSPSPAGARS